VPHTSEWAVVEKNIRGNVGQCLRLSKSSAREEGDQEVKGGTSEKEGVESDEDQKDLVHRHGCDAMRFSRSAERRERIVVLVREESVVWRARAGKVETSSTWCGNQPTGQRKIRLREYERRRRTDRRETEKRLTAREGRRDQEMLNL